MVGAGATGGYFGARLVQAGRDVTFLLREQRAQGMREHGLQILSPRGDVTVHPAIVTAGELREQHEPFDLICVSTKAYQLKSAMADFAPVVGPQTMILPMLNGMRQLAILDDRFSAAQVLGGSVRIHADLDAVGRVQHQSALSEFSYGERSGQRTERIEAVDQVMQGAGFEAILQPDILATLWQKWWILASLGSTCVLGRGAIGEVAAVPHGPEMARALVKECTDIATASGYPPSQAMLDEHIERLTLSGSRMTSSMFRHMIKGAPVEADHILGDLLEHANGVAAPLISAAYVQLKVYELTRVG